jgi:hypothetical protein
MPNCEPHCTLAEHPEPGFILKDFRKMFIDLEHLKGACFFHYFGKAHYDSVRESARARNSILNKYQKALASAQEELKPHDKNRWFLLYILDATNQEFNCCCISNMAEDKLVTNENWLSIQPETAIPK